MSGKISPKLAYEKTNAEKVCFLDVRSKDEFSSGAPVGSRCLPLDQLDQELHQLPKDQILLLSCQSGRRSEKAAQILKEKGYTQVLEVEGGFSAWKEAGLPIAQTKKSALPIMRQVQLTAGLLVLSGVFFGHFVHPSFYVLSGFVGAGLSFAGLSGWCGMAMLLEKMPWNRTC